MALKISKQNDSHEFKPILTEIEESPASPLGRIIFWIIIIVILFFGIWMYAGKVDVIISARGKIFPEEEIKIIQPLDGGVVSKILVKEGDLVNKGQVLMEIDPSTTQPELKSMQENLNYLQLEMERLQLLSERKPFSFTTNAYDKELVEIQKGIYSSIINALQNQLRTKEMELEKIENQIKSTKIEEKQNNSLLTIALEKKKRLEAVLDIIAKDEYDAVLNEISTYQSTKQQSGCKVEELKACKKQMLTEMAVIKENFRASMLKELSDEQKKAIELKARVEVISFRNERERIASPIEGYINELFIHTIGGVVTPAQKLISIVPINSPLIIKAVVMNKDIGFIKKGMLVSIKIDTFSFQKYGILQGKVRQVSKDSIENEKLGPVYEVYITPIDKYLMVEGKKRYISSGMSLTAEIKVGKRRIIEFFIYPLIKYLDEGMSVR